MKRDAHAPVSAHSQHSTLNLARSKARNKKSAPLSFRMTDAAAEAALVETYTAQLAALKGLLADKHFRGRDLADKG